MHRRRGAQLRRQLLEWRGLGVEEHQVREARHGAGTYHRGEDAVLVEARARTQPDAAQCTQML